MMVLLTTDVIITLAVIGAVVVLILLLLLICCVCKKCDQCARWSRHQANNRQDVAIRKAITDSRREFDEIRAQHIAARDELRVKYNLNSDTATANVIP